MSSPSPPSTLYSSSSRTVGGCERVESPTAGRYHTHIVAVGSLFAMSGLDVFTIELVARKVHERESGFASLRWIDWEQLTEEERDDVRYQVRSVLDALEEQMRPHVPGLLGFPPPLDAELLADAETGPDRETWRLTGS